MSSYEKKYESLKSLFEKNNVIDEVTNPSEFEEKYEASQRYTHPDSGDTQTAEEWYLEYLEMMSHIEEELYSKIMSFDEWGMSSMIFDDLVELSEEHVREIDKIGMQFLGDVLGEKYIFPSFPEYGEIRVNKKLLETMPKNYFYESEWKAWIDNYEKNIMNF